MGNEIAKRYRLCTNCSDRILSGSCDGKCKEYWKYVGATEQKAIDIEKVCDWLSNYFVFEHEAMSAQGCDAFLRAFRKAMEE